MKIRHRRTYYAISLLICDICMILAAFKCSFWLKFESNWLPIPKGIPEYTNYAQAFVLSLALIIALYRAMGLYIEEKILRWIDEMSLVIKGTATAFIFILAASFFYRSFSFSRSYLVMTFPIVILQVLLGRWLLSYLYLMYRQSKNKFKEIIVVGLNPSSIRYAIHVKREARLCSKVIGLVQDRQYTHRTYKGIPILGHKDQLESILQKDENVNEVIVISSHISNHEMIKFMTLCEKYLISFKWMPDFFGLIATKMEVKYEEGIPLMRYRESPLLDWENRLLKRTMDLILSLGGLVVLAPLLVLVAVIIKMDSKGSIFYSQERVGEDGKVFKIYKFRTMQANAEEETGPIWAKPDDKRRTVIGSLLRRTNIDELPQLWNVLVGEMSLVGPRPERPHFVGQFKEDIPRYMGRHKIKSGLTGWAQVNGLRGDTSIKERTKYDLYYIENWSLFLDLKILFRTVFAFKNAY